MASDGSADNLMRMKANELHIGTVNVGGMKDHWKRDFIVEYDEIPKTRVYKNARGRMFAKKGEMKGKWMAQVIGDMLRSGYIVTCQEWIKGFEEHLLGHIRTLKQQKILSEKDAYGDQWEPVIMEWIPSEAVSYTHLTLPTICSV